MEPSLTCWLPTVSRFATRGCHVFVTSLQILVANFRFVANTLRSLPMDPDFCLSLLVIGIKIYAVRSPLHCIFSSRRNRRA